MKYLIYQYDDRGDLYKISDIIKDYAQKHNYDYKFFTKYYINIPPYWQKVFIAKDLINQYDIIFYIDSDAVIHCKDYPLEYYLDKKDMAISYEFATHKFNAGAFIIKNTPIMRSMLEKWCSYYDNGKWKNVNGKLKTNSFYAGIDYEQGSFDKLILTYYKEYINVLYNHIFQNITFIDIPDKTFIIHFYSYDAKLGIYMFVNYLNNENIRLNDLINKIQQIVLFVISKRKKIELYKKMYIK